MPVRLLMPALSPTMESGTLARWLVSEGDTVEAGDLIAEIETDKAMMEFEAVDEGTIARILVPEGTENVAVNTPIAILAEEGEDITDADLEEPAESTPAEPSSSPAPPPSAPSPAPGAGTSAGNNVEPATAGSQATNRSGGPTASRSGRIASSPLARRLARERSIDLAEVTGTGPFGRVIKRDIEGFTPKAVTAMPAPETAAPPARAPEAASAESIMAGYHDRSHTEVKLDGMRKAIAARLSEAKQTIPHFYLRRQIAIDRLLALRKDVNEGLEHKGIRVSVNDFIIRACAESLQDIPECNAIWAGDRIVQFDASDIAVAVAIEGGLLTPVIRDCESMKLSAISVAMKDLAGRARSRKLAPEDYTGGCCTISNLGMFGIDNFDAIINPPHSFILAIGAGRKTTVVGSDDSISVATVMDVTMSVDHRVIDGALGARFLDSFADHLQNPAALLV